MEKKNTRHGILRFVGSREKNSGSQYLSVSEFTPDKFWLAAEQFLIPVFGQSVGGRLQIHRCCSMMHLCCLQGKSHVILTDRMTHRIFLSVLCSAVCFAVSGVAAPAPSQAQLKSDLETAYNTWRQHMVRQNYEGWQKTTSAYRKVKVRNMAVSEKRPWPQSLFNQHISPPSLLPLRYIGSVVKGPTAAATYFGKVDWGIGGAPSENAYVLLFTNERGEWKYDQARFFNLAQLPKVRERLRNNDATVLEEQDGFQPTGIIPPVPPVCPVPQYIGKIFVDCPGRIVKARINNVSDHVFEDARMAEVISGGLRNGINSIDLNVTPAPNGKPGPLNIMVYVMPETVGNFPGQAYSCAIPANQAAQNGTATFTITADTIRQMAPQFHKQPTPAQTKK